MGLLYAAATALSIAGFFLLTVAAATPATASVPSGRNTERVVAQGHSRSSDALANIPVLQYPTRGKIRVPPDVFEDGLTPRVSLLGDIGNDGVQGKPKAEAREEGSTRAVKSKGSNEERSESSYDSRDTDARTGDFAEAEERKGVVERGVKHINLEGDTAESSQFTASGKGSGAILEEISETTQPKHDRKGRSENDSIMFLNRDPLVPLLLFPKAPRLHGMKAVGLGVLILLFSVWMVLEKDDVLSKGPANIVAPAFDLELEDVASVGSAVAAGVAAIFLFFGVYRHVVSVHRQRRWIRRAEQGISMTRKLHQNRMQRLLERRGLPVLTFSKSDDPFPSFGDEGESLVSGDQQNSNVSDSSGVETSTGFIAESKGEFSGLLQREI